MSIAKAERLRVVLDSNVYVSAFTYRRGVPFNIWLAALEHRYVLLISPAIVDEMAAVLRARFDWDDDDDRILECAVAGKANLIVSGDHHLRDLKSFRDIGVIRPVDFHRTLPDLPRS